MITALGGRLLVNDSFAGSTVCFDPQYEVASYGCSDHRTSSLGEDGEDPDVIMIFMGLNDRGYGKQLYPTCDAEAHDLSIFSVAYDAMLARLQENYPCAQICCLTLPIAQREEQSRSEHAKRTSAAYSEVIAASAKQHDCRLIDISHMEPYETTDGLHPNARGMTAIANAVLRAWQECAAERRGY